MIPNVNTKIELLESWAVVGFTEHKFSSVTLAWHGLDFSNTSGVFGFCHICHEPKLNDFVSKKNISTGVIRIV